MSSNMPENHNQNWSLPELDRLIGDSGHNLSSSSSLPFSAQTMPPTTSTLSGALYSWSESATIAAIKSIPLALSMTPTTIVDSALSPNSSTYLSGCPNTTFPFNSSCETCSPFLESNITSANCTNGTMDEQMERNIYILPLYQQIIWSFIFGSMVIAAAGGNIIVIWIVLTNKRMRTVTNYFLVNLSIADIMVSTLNVIFNFIYMLNSDWPFGELYCKVTNFSAILSVGASVFTLMAISVDRYLAIVHPLRPRMSRTNTLIIIAFIWTASSLLSLPNAIVSKTYPENFTNGDSRVVCYLEWSDGESTKSRLEYIYNVIILLVTYMLPIVSMSYTYFRVGLELWGSQSIGECTAKQMESIKSKRKIVKMMMIVVAIFGVCWAPYHIYFLLAHHYPQIINSKYVQHTYLAIYWLAMSNSVYNPLVYCWMNWRFRQGFRNIFCCACFGPKEQTIYDKPRYHGVARYSCASEACITDMRVRFNGNGNISTATLQATESTNVNGAGISKTSPLRARITVNREML